MIAALTLMLPCVCVAAERIITMAPNLTELVCAVNACDRLVGVDQRSDYPTSVQALPRIGDALNINLEAVLALKPDLILAWESGTDPQRVRQLEQLGLRTEWIRVGTLDQIGVALRRVGTLIGPASVQAADAAAREYSSRLQEFRARRYTGRRPGVLYQIDVQPLYTINRDSPISEAIEICGGRNVFANLPQLAGIVSFEAVLTRNPDVILFPSELGAETIKRQWRRWPMLRAVQNQALYAINDSLLARASPRMLDGIQSLCTVLEMARARR